MIPGFSGPLAHPPARFNEGLGSPVKLAGLWDPPDQKTCRFVRTDTFCTGFVNWCKEVSICFDRNSPLGHEESKTPYPCGVCLGFSSPDDW